MDYSKVTDERWKRYIEKQYREYIWRQNNPHKETHRCGCKSCKSIRNERVKIWQKKQKGKKYKPVKKYRPAKRLEFSIEKDSYYLSGD